MLSAYLIHVGSPQSKDGDEAMRRQLESLKADTVSIKEWLLGELARQRSESLRVDREES